MIAGMGASLVNAANLGFPIAEYVLGDVRLAAPIVMFQLACYAPLYVMVMDQLTRRERSGPEDRPVHPRLAVLRSAGMSMLNPVIVASMLGLLFSWQGWSFPEPVSEAIELLAGASIPLMLLAFGLSLVGVKPLNKEGGRRRDATLASGIKLLVHPAIAFLIAYFLFGLEGTCFWPPSSWARSPPRRTCWSPPCATDRVRTSPATQCWSPRSSAFRRWCSSPCCSPESPAQALPYSGDLRTTAPTERAARRGCRRAHMGAAAPPCARRSGRGSNGRSFVAGAGSRLCSSPW
ncbi:AEC family transporter [Nesterenkonia pannonica]|uniref:AEC family transporter n=1 Tax=Nesterenkonia pannonica TaxID=1548602 RepID=UPI002164AE8F|nr:AEC family transporter [Nesterenkonia pannonica]